MTENRSAEYSDIGYVGQPGDGETFRVYEQGFEAAATSLQAEIARLRRIEVAARALRSEIEVFGGNPNRVLALVAALDEALA